MQIGKKFSLLSGAMVAGTTIIIMMLSLTISHGALTHQAAVAQESAMKTLTELVNQKGKEFKTIDGRFYVGDYLINDNFELPDKVKSICGGAATIFMGDTRISTNVMNAEGKRAIGTKLQGPAREAAIVRGESYRGQAQILGETYLAAYDPIKNASGQVLGVLFVGVKKSEYFNSFYNMIWIIATVTVLALGVAYLAMSYLANKITHPLSRIAEGMERSDLTLSLEEHGDDEIGALSRAFNAHNLGLKGKIQMVADYAARVASGSTELAASADEMERAVADIAKVSEHLRAAGESVTEAMRDLSMKAGSVAANTRDSHQESQEAVADTEHSTKAGESVVKSMNEIQLVMKEIVNAVQVIKEIANQTNLLSLNAAIHGLNWMLCRSSGPQEHGSPAREGIPGQGPAPCARGLPRSWPPKSRIAATLETLSRKYRQLILKFGCAHGSTPFPEEPDPLFSGAVPGAGSGTSGSSKGSDWREWPRVLPSYLHVIRR